MHSDQVRNPTGITRRQRTGREPRCAGRLRDGDKWPSRTRLAYQTTLELPLGGQQSTRAKRFQSFESPVRKGQVCHDL